MLFFIIVVIFLQSDEHILPKNIANELISFEIPTQKCIPLLGLIFMSNTFYGRNMPLHGHREL